MSMKNEANDDNGDSLEVMAPHQGLKNVGIGDVTEERSEVPMQVSSSNRRKDCATNAMLPTMEAVSRLAGIAREAHDSVQPLPISVPDQPLSDAPGAYALGGLFQFGRSLRGTSTQGGQEAAPVVQGAADGLVEARAVNPHDQDQGQRDLEEAVPVLHTTNKGTNKPSKGGSSALLLVILAAVCIILPVVVISANRNPDVVTIAPSTMPKTGWPSTAPSPPPTMLSSLDAILALLPNYTIDAIHRNNDGRKGTPQQLALQWLLEDPGLESYNATRILQRYGLAALYFATGGHRWNFNNSWLDYQVHECRWFSSSRCNCTKPCQDDNQTFINLELNANNLRGTLPPEVFLLPSLRSITFKGNAGLEGSIPWQIQDAHNLETINMPGNSFSGSLPQDLWQLTSLKKFRLCCNHLEGTIHSELGLLSSQLQHLVLDTNLLTGQIPSEIGLLSNVTDMRLGLNGLSGSLPTELGLCTSVKLLLLSETGAVQGPIPSELGMMTDMFIVSMENTRLSGSIPTELGNWHGLWSLEVTNSLLSGLLPSELGLCRNIRGLDVAANSFSGSVPTEFAFMTNMTDLFLDRNQLSGKLPSELGTLTSLTNLRLQSNVFTGTIPDEFNFLAHKTIFFNASNNLLTGVVPGEMCKINFTSFDCTASLCGCDCPCPTL